MTDKERGERGLALPVGDAPAAEVVGRDFHGDDVTGNDADEMFPHLAREVGQHLVLCVAGVDLNDKLGVR